MYSGVHVHQSLKKVTLFPYDNNYNIKENCRKSQSGVFHIIILLYKHINYV